jgi:hypothetical protein
MRRVLVVLMAGSLAFLGAACGGDDEERLSTEEFEAQGNQICQEGNDRTNALFEEQFGDLEEEPPADEVEDFIDDEVVPSIEQQIDELRDLNPPEDIEDEFEELLDDAQQAADDLGDSSAEELFAEETDPFEEVNRRAAELGLTACAAEE